MTLQTPIDQLHWRLGDFVDGTSSTAWKSISQLLQKPLRRPGEPAVQYELLDACWQLLSDPNFPFLVNSFYTPRGPWPGSESLSDRLVRNARALFATSCVATVAADAKTPADAALLLNWFKRAVVSLDSSYFDLNAPEGLDSEVSLSPDELIEWACERMGEPTPVVVCVRLWSRWWLDHQEAPEGETRRTWIAWVSEKLQGVGFLKVSDSGLPFPCLIEHPRVALMPMDDHWLAAIQRAWELSHGATWGRTILWDVQLSHSGSLVLKGRSAGCAFYVALACLREGRACDPSRAMLAALVDDEPRPVEVNDIDRKIKALRGSISSFGVAATQTQLIHPDTTILKCGSLADALEFMSGVATRLRAFASILAETTDDLFIEPMLLRTASVTTQFTGDTDANDPRSIEDTIGEPASVALKPLLSGTIKRIVLIADSGFGKTALSEWTMRRLAKASLDFFEPQDATFEGKRHLFPLLLTANHLLTAMIEAEARHDGRDLVDFDNRTALDLLLRAAVIRYSHHEPAIRFLLECASGKLNDFEVLIIVDGLDEVRVERRRLVAQLLKRLGAWPCRMLVTGREYAFDPTDIEDSIVYRIREFGPQQTRRYVETMLGPEQARVVLRLFNSNPATRVFAHVPLLLSMVCRGLKRAAHEAGNVAEQAAQKIRTDYPTKTALYRELFLDRLGQELAPALADQRLEVLSTVGREWMKTTSPNGEVSERKIIEWIGTDKISAIPIGFSLKFVEQLGPALVASSLLEDFVSVGILTPTADRKSYRATHPSFIEYLAGRHLAANIDKGDQAALDELLGHSLNPSWRGTTPFVAGELKNLLSLVSKLNVSIDPFHLQLFTAAKWLAEAKPSEVLEGEVAKIGDQLVTLLKSESPIDRYKAIDAIEEMGLSWRHVLAPLIAPLLNDQKSNVWLAALEAACFLDAPGAIERITRYVREPNAKGRERLLRRLAAVDPATGTLVAKELVLGRNLTLQAAAIDVLMTEGSAEVDTVVAQLKSDYSFSPELASRALAATGNPVVAEKLRPLLQDDDKHVRVMAVQTLASLDVEWRVELLNEMAADASRQVRIAVVAALGRIGTHESLTRVRPFLYDKEEQVVLKALDVISRADVLHPSDVEALLNHNAPMVRLHSAAVFHSLGIDDYLPLLHSAVQNDNDYDQIALKQLAFVKDPRSVSFLISLLPQSRPPIQAMIARTLGSIGDPQAVPALIELLASNDLNTRLNVVAALGDIRHPTASMALIERLNGDGDSVKRAAVKALGQVGDARAIVPLIEVLKAAEQEKVVSEVMMAISSFATLPELLAGMKESGGTLAVAQSCPPGVVYALLFPLIWSAPPEVWQEEAAAFTELTIAAATPRLANTQPTRRHA
jgi:HEAT repeat protein